MMLHVNLMQGISVRMHWSLMYVIHVCMYPHIKKIKKKEKRERKRETERERVCVCEKERETFLYLEKGIHV